MHLSPDEYRAALYCVSETLRRRRLTGQPIPVWMANLASVLSSRGPEPVVNQQDSEPERIGSAQAAQLIGCTRRHISRIATSLDGQLVVGRWTFDRATVIEYAQARREVRDE